MHTPPTRLIYLDADMAVARNIDFLFELPPAFYAVSDCAFGRDDQAERDACPFFRPDRRSYFNAGFFLMEPDTGRLAEFGRLLAAGAIRIGGYAEQDFLNEYYRDSWQALPWGFNAQKGIRHHHPDVWRLDEVFIVHFTDRKPWNARHHEENAAHRDICDWWWGLYEGRKVHLVQNEKDWDRGRVSQASMMVCGGNTCIAADVAVPDAVPDAVPKAVQDAVPKADEGRVTKRDSTLAPAS
jgi:lipopolysaccharide biosynthesis glycosyltransferase